MRKLKPKSSTGGIGLQEVENVHSLLSNMLNDLLFHFNLFFNDFNDPEGVRHYTRSHPNDPFCKGGEIGHILLLQSKHYSYGLFALWTEHH